MSHFGQIVRPCFGRMGMKSISSSDLPVIVPEGLNHSRAKCRVILVFLQSNYPSKQEIGAAARADESEGEGRSGGAPLQREDGEFPVRTGTQRTRNSPLHTVMPGRFTRNRRRRGG